MDYFAAQLVSGKDEKENYLLSLIVKKDYSFNDAGQCIASDIQPVLVNKCCYYENNSELLEHDYELVACKLLTDIVIQGKAYNPQINSGQFEASVQMGDYLNSILIKGNRKVFYEGNKLKFTPPEKIEAVPLRYDYAYGGRDQGAIDNLPPVDEQILKHIPAGFDWHADTFYNYPRNPEGKGYVVENNKVFLETIDLPNLEDPEDQLTPENLIVGNPEQWYKMPLPRCTDWLPSSFFPRVAYIGILENFLNRQYPLKEVQRGWADKSLFNFTKDNQFEFNYRCVNAASLGFQLPLTYRPATIRLVNIHPRIKNFILTLPKEHPSIWVDGRKGKLLETRPVIDSVQINPDKNKLSLIWRGSAPAIRPYLEEELKEMPYKLTW